MSCPLCLSISSVPHFQDKKRNYFLCSHCQLIFVPREQMLSPQDEKSRYEAHENSDADSRYRDYLSGICEETLPYLKKGDEGLDFGCGRSTLLSTIYHEKGHSLDFYDLYFHPREEIWQKKFDFIILSEVIEHLAAPLLTMQRLLSLLKEDGRIFIKTKFYPEKIQDFANWFYRRDLTHVQFFNKVSMNYLAGVLNEKSAAFVGQDLTLIR